MSDALKISREVRDRDTHELLGWIVAGGFRGTHFSMEHPVVGRLDFPWVAVQDGEQISHGIGVRKDLQLSLIRKCPGFVEYQPK